MHIFNACLNQFASFKPLHQNCRTFAETRTVLTKSDGRMYVRMKKSKNYVPRPTSWWRHKWEVCLTCILDVRGYFQPSNLMLTLLDDAINVLESSTGCAELPDCLNFGRSVSHFSYYLLSLHFHFNDAV